MGKTNGEGRSASEKSGRLIVPGYYRRRRKEIQQENDEWAAKAGPVTVTRKERP